MPHKLTATVIASAALIALGAASYAAAAVGSPALRPALPSLFAKQIRAVNRAPRAPAVLLPGSMPLGTTHLYPSGGPNRSRYDLEIGAVRHCGGADACFVAGFTAARASTVFGRRVRVRGASKAGFIPLSCGASCAPPQIDFLVRGVRYTIQANLSSRRSDRAVLVAAAESAISAGPR